MQPRCDPPPPPPIDAALPCPLPAGELPPDFLTRDFGDKAGIVADLWLETRAALRDCAQRHDDLRGYVGRIRQP